MLDITGERSLSLPKFPVANISATTFPVLSDRTTEESLREELLEEIVGNIEHRDYANDENVTWIVNPSCPTVSIRSTFFETEYNYDFVHLDGEKFSGDNGHIGQVMKSPFNVTFTSDESTTKSGFSLTWECIGKK